ncbi:hypothetical protein BZG36_03983 [Bifiguratus adelaidae]|uniref:RING-type domain-containing protein n=1 Tax=Bifiguratus adelaidae TaxID=1938954 RepID=A0A261Y1N1_9FUNG|nr:hypothetical protein BZG36_03983 [Bifiguratus adelaidae]
MAQNQAQAGAPSNHVPPHIRIETPIFQSPWYFTVPTPPMAPAPATANSAPSTTSTTPSPAPTHTAYPIYYTTIGNPGQQGALILPFFAASGITYFLPPLMMNMTEQSFQGQPPASKAAMMDLELITPSSLPTNMQHECVICQDNLVSDEDPQPIRRMPCGHMWHEDCIFAWLKQSNTCPTCRYEVMTDNEDYNAGVKRRMNERQDHLTAARKVAQAHTTPTVHCECPDHEGSATTHYDSDMITLPYCQHHFNATCLMDHIKKYRPQTSIRDEYVDLHCPKCAAGALLPMADLAPAVERVFQRQCALAKVGCCACVDDIWTDKRLEVTKIAECLHSFHQGCLQDAARIEGYTVPTNLGPHSLELRCPTCRQPGVAEFS